MLTDQYPFWPHIHSLHKPPLEAESGVVPLDIHLDQAVMRARDVPRCKEVIELAIAKIRCGGVGCANPIFLGGKIGARGSNQQR